MSRGQAVQAGCLPGACFTVLGMCSGALGGQVDATIRDRYYGFSDAGKHLSPMLLRSTQEPPGQVRKERLGQAMQQKDITDRWWFCRIVFSRSLR